MVLIRKNLLHFLLPHSLYNDIDLMKPDAAVYRKDTS